MTLTLHPATLRFYLLWAGLTGAELEEQKRLRPGFAAWLVAPGLVAGPVVEG